MVDTIRYQVTETQTKTAQIDAEEWCRDDGFLRMELAEETLIVPFERVFWIRREEDGD